MARILVVEDDDALAAELVRQLERAGHAPTRIGDGELAARAELDRFDLAILDLMLPGRYGLDVLKGWRARSEIPVLLLTARDHTADKVRGLGLGADDYITKPFWPEELLARVGARLRRGGARGGPVRVGRLVIDVGRDEVSVDGVRIELTRVERAILFTLAERPDHSVTRALLADRALERESAEPERTIDVHVSRIRKKLGDASSPIKTVWGVGYRLERAG